MITLTVDNSYSKISGLNTSQYTQLKKLLSYTIPSQSAYFSGFHNTRRYLIDKVGSFPTGLLYIVEKFILNNHLNHILADLRKRPECPRIDLNIKLRLTPYPEQENAALACLERFRGIVVMPTGTGKSLVAALIINELKVSTLVVVPTLELKRQLTESLALAFGVDRVGSSKDKKVIAVENVDALDTKKVLTGYDAVIIDEFHHSAAKTYRNLNKYAWKNIFYRFGLTATPFRSDDSERLLLESVLSEVIYEIDYNTSVKNGYIVPLEAYYVDIPKKDNIDGYTWQQVYSELVVNHKIRNTIICGLLKKLSDKSVSALCLVKEIKHGTILSQSTDIPFANGEDANTTHLLSRFNSKAASCLIGTTGVLGEGVDTRPTEYVIIAGLGKSRNAFMQQVGRAFRCYTDKTSCKIIIFCDKSHKWTLAHFKHQCKILKEEYGVIPVKLEV